MNGLSKAGLLEETLVVITADHGEGLGDHGYWFEHGDQLFDEALRVPLLIVGSGIPSNQRIDDQVQNIDLLPTILSWAGVPVPREIDGQNLLPLMRAQESGREYVFAESGRDFHAAPWRGFAGTDGYLRMVRSNEWKLIYTPRHMAHHLELFNLRDDPKEQINIVDQHPEIVDEMVDQLRSWFLKDQRLTSSQDMDLSPELADHLRSLGYLD